MDDLALTWTGPDDITLNIVCPYCDQTFPITDLDSIDTAHAHVLAHGDEPDPDGG